MRLFLLLLAGACTPPDPGPGTSETDADTDADADADGDTDTDADTDVPVLLLSSGGGGSTVKSPSSEYVEEDCPTDCGGNTAPTLDPAVFLVNGVLTSTLAAAAGDEVAVLVAYADAECNAACGALYYAWSAPEASEGSAGSLPSNLPCDTAGSSVYLGFDYGVVASGDYSWSIRVEDACAGTSARVEGAYTVP